MKLYFSRGACSLACRIIINELNLPCDYEAVDLKTKKTATGKDYLLINPKGAVPALELNNGEVLTENAVVQEYLADQNNATQLLPSMGDFKRYRVKEWLNYVTTELHKSFGTLFNAAVPQELKDKIFMPLLEKKFDYVAKQLGDKNFLMGDQFTLPDGYLFVMLTWLKKFNLPLSKWPNLEQYYNNLKTRPAIQKSLQEEGLA